MTNVFELLGKVGLYFLSIFLIFFSGIIFVESCNCVIVVFLFGVGFLFWTISLDKNGGIF